MLNEPITSPKKNEATLYNQADVQITSLRAVFGAKTYAVSNITSVEATTNYPSGCLSAILAVFGLVLLYLGVASYFNNWSPDNNPTFIVIGILLLTGAYFSNKASKKSYTVNLTTSAGEVKAYTSFDWETIRQIVEALNNAIIQKG